MSLGHVFLGSHLGQTRYGSRELVCVKSFRVELIEINFSWNDQFHPAIVEDVHHPGEASGFG